MYAPTTLIAASLLIAWFASGSILLAEDQHVLGGKPLPTPPLAQKSELERFQEKWTPLFRPKERKNNNLEPGFDSIKTNKALDGDLIRKLQKWIGSHTNYDVSGAIRSAPKVRFVTSRQHIRYEGRHITIDRKLKAAYDSTNRIIFLVKPWTASNPHNLSSLVHELMHDVQFRNRDWPCSHAPEWEAYKLQETWLLERGIDPHYNWFQIQLRSRCQKDIHP